MNLLTAPQLSPEWWEFKVGKISGTRFGQAISGRKNRLLYDLLNEKLQGYIEQDDYESEDMKFGTENEPIARDLYIEKSGIQFDEVGAIKSDFSDIHMASPDGLAYIRIIDRSKIVYAEIKDGIVLEIKCTSNGAIHIQRFAEGVESNHMPQIINYFAVSDEVKEVHWVSYCPYRQERPLVIWIFTRESVLEPATAKKPAYTINDAVIEGRNRIKEIESQLIELEQSFIF